MYLAIATLLTLTTLVARGGTDHEVFRPAARGLFAVTVAGLCVLWPMLRFSQAIPRENTGATVFKDLVVLLAPVQAIIWPQVFSVLADWSVGVCAAVSAVTAGWAVLIGGLVAVGMAQIARVEETAAPGPPWAGRTTWMLIVVALVSIGPLVGLLSERVALVEDTGDEVAVWALSSPLTAIFEITKDRPWTGIAATDRPGHWAAIAAIWAAALLLWAFVPRWASPRGRVGVGGLDSPVPPTSAVDPTARVSTRPEETAGSPESPTMEMVTKADKETIEARLAQLIANRPVISQRIAEARAHGDLRENGDYHAAREQQGMDEAEIRRLEQRLAGMMVIDETMAKAVEGVVMVGATVKLKDLDNNDEDLFRLVGESSPVPPADYVEVTVTSPMGEALHKARIGDTIRYQAPRGIKRFLVVEIL
jgi:transcription elongation factor GreA